MALSPKLAARPDARRLRLGTFSELADTTRARPAVQGVRLVAVDGPSGSGKSTLARRLARALGNAPMISTDDFLSWDNLAGWWPRMEEQVLGPLLAGRPARYQVRDWENDELGDSLGSWRTVPPAPVVVIEGVTSSRRAVSDRLAFAVWVEAPRDIRLRRGVERDGEARRAAWIDWMRREEEFFAADRTRERADVCVDGSPSVSHDPEREYTRLV